MPVQAVVVREVDKEGKVVDPDAVAAGAGAERAGQHRRRRRPARRATEKDGVFVVDGEKAASSP